MADAGAGILQVPFLLYLLPPVSYARRSQGGKKEGLDLPFVLLSFLASLSLTLQLPNATAFLLAAAELVLQVLIQESVFILFTTIITITTVIIIIHWY